MRDRRLPPVGGDSALARSQVLQAPGGASGVASSRLGSFVANRLSAEGLGIGSWRELHLKLIERFAPASVIVTADFEMVHISRSVRRPLPAP